MDTQDIAKMLDTGTGIAIIWLIDDVKSVRPDLNDAQCMEVLRACDRNHDATIGISWDIIEFWADDLYPA